MNVYSISLVWLLLIFGDVALGQAPLERPISRDDSRWQGAWTIGTPKSHGFEAAVLDRIADEIGRMPGVYSFLLVSGGDLVVERYYRQGNREKPHNLKSASKSLISILTGIAIDKGYIRLDQPISELLTEARAEGAAKGAITVEQLLSMTSGLETTSYGGYNRWIASDNWVKSALELPLVAEPGTFYQYSTGNTHLLSAIIAAASGTSTLEFANRYLFEPMNIEIRDWQLDPQGIHIGGNNLLMTPRDMAKIGLLFLDGGRWGDRQLVSQQWVERSTRPSGLGQHEVYGTHSNLWWTDTEGGDFAAVGFGGQYIYVSPADDCIIVVTSTLYSKGDDWTAQLFELLRRDVLQRTDTPDIRFAARDEEIEPSAETLVLRRALALAREGLADIVRQLGGEVVGPPRFETTSRVNFRTGPQQSAALLGLLEPGVPVSVISSKGKWLEVRVGGRQGWLYADYVGPAAIAPDLGPEIASLRRALERTDSVRTDSAVPAVSTGSLATLPAGSADELVSQRAARQQLADDLARQREATKRVSGQLDTANIERQSLLRSLSARQAQLDNAQARVSALELLLQEIRVAADAPDELPHESQAELASLRESAARLRESLVRRESTISGMTGAMTSAAERIAALRLEVQSKDEVLRRTLAEKQVIEATLEQDRRKIALLQDALGTSDTKFGMAENDLAAAKTTAATQVAALRSQVQTKEEALQRALNEKQAIDTALGQERRKVVLLEEALETSNTRLNTAQSELTAAATAAAALQSDTRSIEEALEQALIEKRAVASTLEQGRRQVTQLQDALEVLNSRLIGSHRELTETQAAAAAQLAALESQMQSKDDTLQQAWLDKQTTEATLEQQRQRIASLQQALDSSNNKLSTVASNLATAQATSAAQLAALESETQSKEVALQQALIDKQTTEATLEQQRQRIASLQQALDSSNNKLSTVASNLATAQATSAAQLAALESETQSKEVALQQALIDKQAADDTLELGRQQVMQLQGALDVLNSKLIGSRKELAETQATAATQLAALQSQMQSKNDTLQQASLDKQATEAMLEQERQRVASLQQQLDSSNTTLSTVENNFAAAAEAAAAQVAALQFDAAQNAVILKQVLAEKQSLQTTLERDGQKIVSLEDTVAQLNARLDESQADLSAARREQTVTTSRADELTAAIAQLQQELGSQVIVANETEAERGRLADRLQVAESQEKTLRGQLELAQSQVADLENSLVESQRIADQLIAARAESIMLQESLTVSQSALVAETASRKAAAMQAERTQTESAAALAAVQSELELKTENLDRALAAKEAVEVSLEQQRERTASLEQSLAQATGREESTRVTLTGQLDQTGAELELSREALQRANNENSEAAAELARLVGQAEVASAELARAGEALSEQRQVSDAAQRRIADLETVIDADRREFENRDAAASAALAEATAREAGLRDSLAAANARRNELSDDLDEAQGLAGLSANRVSELQTAMAGLQTRLDEQKNQFTALDEQRSRLAEQLVAAAADAARQRNELDEAASALAQSRVELATVQDENKSQSSKMKNLAAELVDARARETALQDRLDAAQAEYAALETALAESQRIAGQRQQLLATAASQDSALRNQLGDAQKYIAELELAIEQGQQVADERDEAQSAVDALQSSIAALQESLANNQVALADKEQVLAAREAAAIRAEAERLKTAEQLAQRRSESAQMSETLDRALADKAAVDDSLRQVQQRVASLEESLAQATRRDDVTRMTLTGQIARLDAELELARESLQQANREKEQSVAALARLSQQTAVTADARAAPAGAMPAIEAEPIEQVNTEATRAFVERSVRRWSSAWSNQDVQSYLAAYADDFVPPGNLTLAGWQNQRRARVSAPQFIEVSIADLAIELTGAGAVATFTQNYRSNTYSDRTRKELEFRLTADGWRIVRERSR